MTANEDPTLKTVGPSVFTDRHTHTQTNRQTHTQTHRQTDMTNFMIVAHPQMGNYNKIGHVCLCVCVYLCVCVCLSMNTLGPTVFNVGSLFSANM